MAAAASVQFAGRRAIRRFKVGSVDPALTSGWLWLGGWALNSPKQAQTQATYRRVLVQTSGVEVLVRKG